MKNTYICLGFLLLSSGCQREVLSLHEQKTSVDQTREFLHWFRSQGPEQGTFYLLDSVSFSGDPWGYFSIQECLNDSIDLTPDERSQISREARHPRLAAWTRDWFQDAQIIPKEEINQLFSHQGVDGGWSAFYNKYGNSFSDFSMPIFLRDNTLCLFYSGNHCGGLCGSGALVLYKRDGNSWVQVRVFDSWIS